jgi:hypothetical protein
MKTSLRRWLILVVALIFCSLFVSALPIQAAEISFVRFKWAPNYSGGSILAERCINAKYHWLTSEEKSPNPRRLGSWKYGSINGCTSHYPAINVRVGDVVEIGIGASDKDPGSNLFGAVGTKFYEVTRTSSGITSKFVREIKPPSTPTPVTPTPVTPTPVTPTPTAKHTDTQLRGAVENGKTTIFLKVCGQGKHYRFQSFSVDQNQILWDKVYGAIDGCSKEYRAAINAETGEILRFTSTVMNGTISDSEFNQRRRDTCRVDSPGVIRCRQSDTPPPFPKPVPPPEPPPPAPGHWNVPHYRQGDSRWDSDRIGACNNTIGKVGCALTSLTMVARFYGADKDPGTMNSCLGKYACLLDWSNRKVGTCTNGRLKWVAWTGFSYTSLERELKKGPVILEISRGRNLHFIVVLGGSGSNPRNYIVNDPGLVNGARTTLSNSLAIFKGYSPSSMRLYTGTPAVTIAEEQESLVEVPPRLNSPQPSNDEPVTGAIALYRNTETEMVLQLAAQSSAGEVTEMRVWTDQHSSEGWQSFASFVSVPLDTKYYVQYRDAAGNTSSEISVEIPSAPDTIQKNIQKVYLPLLAR